MTRFQIAFLAELRSGKWQQITGSYRDGCCGRCAIGVQYEVVNRLGGGDRSVSRFKVMEVDEPGYVALYRKLYELNDLLLLTFAEIADRLEADWKYEGPLV